mmetsp:Transcript_14759/g.36125  ORF Transcript_14759/g.36125 Transcript_14759/m.36125 type:complete len:114 (+) Transcript_14759:93-434(+)
MTTATNPVFPASRDELKAFYPVLEIACADSKSVYDDVKAQRGPPEHGDVAGATYRKTVMETYQAVRTGECSKLFDDLMYCNSRYINDYGAKCKSVRESLQLCAIKNKLGELGN